MVTLTWQELRMSGYTDTNKPETDTPKNLTDAGEEIEKHQVLMLKLAIRSK